MNEYEGMDALWYDSHISLESDIDFYVEEAKKSAGEVLELGCGTGRILIPTARAGVVITGIDRSLPMLEIARRKTAELPTPVRERITLLEGDMRSFKTDHKFDLVTVPFRAFLHLLTVDDQKQALKNIHRHLDDRGRLIFNIFDPNIDIIAAHRGYMGESIKKISDFIHPENGRRVIAWDSRVYDLAEQKIRETRMFDEIGNDGRVLNRWYVPLELRFIYRYEMEHLLELCGFRILDLFGDYDRSEFVHGGEQIWICEKK